MPRTIILTGSGPITSYRLAWRDADGRPVYVWRCDHGEAPHDFGSVEAAEKWSAGVLRLLTEKERAAERWDVVEVHG